MPSVEVRVTKRDIEHGAMWSPHHCPVARAGRRVTTGFCATLSALIVTDGKKLKQIKPPPEVFSFMDDFDMSRPVQPFSFKITVPAKFLRRKP